jgi:predicted RNA-binding protein YlqC (UPF0109 family)
MRELVEHIATALVDDPGAIRTILNANATKLRKRAVLEIVE